MCSHFSSENRRMSLYKSTRAVKISAGIILTMLMACSSPASAQAPSLNTQSSGDGNAQDDHSYLPPSMRSQIESAKSSVTVNTEAEVHTSRKTISLQKAVRRRARRESWDYGGGRGRRLFLFGN
jgi:hypothetical protein